MVGRPRARVARKVARQVPRLPMCNGDTPGRGDGGRSGVGSEVTGK